MAYYGVSGASILTPHQNVRKTWDKLLHEQVLHKSAWKGLVGTDKGGEGDLDSETSNKPIVTKTQLGKESGDLITMGLVASNVKQSWLSATDQDNWFNMGKSGNTQLVDSEAALSFYNLKVRVAHQRFGIVIDGKMTVQRTPYDLLSTAKNQLSTQMAYFLDSSPFFAIYTGWSPNVIREIGLTTADTAEHPNQIYGKGKSAFSGIDSSDKLDTDLLEIVRVFWETNNINPIMVDGDPHALLYVHPYNGKTLRADSLWIDANIQGMARGKDNPVFNNATGKWGGIVVKETNKISTDFDPDSVQINSDEINAGDATALQGHAAGAGINNSDIYMCTLVGANAVARAFALESYMEKRKEDDYGNIYGFAGGYIYGDRRADFALSADSGTDGATKNQSSAIVYCHAPSVTVPTVW